MFQIVLDSMHNIASILILIVILHLSTSTKILAKSLNLLYKVMHTIAVYGTIRFALRLNDYMTEKTCLVCIETELSYLDLIIIAGWSAQFVKGSQIIRDLAKVVYHAVRDSVFENLLNVKLR